MTYEDDFEEPVPVVDFASLMAAVDVVESASVGLDGPEAVGSGDVNLPEPGLPVSEVGSADREAASVPKPKFADPVEDDFGRQVAEALERIAPGSSNALQPHQIPPAEFSDPTSSVTGFVMNAGRNAGKSYAGSRWLHGVMTKYPYSRARIIAPSFGDAVASCVEGPSGILEASHYQVTWHPSAPGGALLKWPNGSVCYVIGTPTAREVDRLRAVGNIRFDWIEEAAANPQLVEVERQARLSRRQVGAKWMATTTPRPLPTIRAWAKDPTVHISTGTSHSNKFADPLWLAELENMYKGTRLYRQEVLGEVLEDVEGALWRIDHIERSRIADTIQMYEMLDAAGEKITRAAVGVDPGNTTGTTGIVTVLMSDARHLYVVEDRSMPAASSNAWAAAAVQEARRWDAPIVAENDSGGDAIRAVLKAADQLDEVTIVPARAQGRGSKGERAEPIALLWERDDWRGHIVGTFPHLEEQLCVPAGTLIATHRGQVPIERLRPTDKVWTRGGLYPIAWSGQTGVVDKLISFTYDGGAVSMTACHPVFLPHRDRFVPAQDVLSSQSLLAVPEWASTGNLLHGEVIDGAERPRDISHAANALLIDNFIEQLGSTTTARFLTDISSTTSTKIRETIGSRILSASHSLNIGNSTHDHSIGLRKSRNRTGGVAILDVISSALDAGRNTTPGVITPHGALSHAVELSTTSVSERSTPNECVYNVMVDGPYHEYFANGVLVHNCTFVPEVSPSPDRLDAMVWACSYLWNRSDFHEATMHSPSHMGTPSTNIRRPGVVSPWKQRGRKVNRSNRVNQE